MQNMNILRFVHSLSSTSLNLWS